MSTKKPTKVKLLLAKYGIKQIDLCNKISDLYVTEYPMTALNQFINGHKTPNIKRLIKVVDAICTITRRKIFIEDIIEYPKNPSVQRVSFIENQSSAIDIVTVSGKSFNCECGIFKVGENVILFSESIAKLDTIKQIGIDPDDYREGDILPIALGI